jgi:hypothetical protein
MLSLDVLDIQFLIFKDYQTPTPKVFITNPDTTGSLLDPLCDAPSGIRDLGSDGCSHNYNISYVL